MSPRRRWLGIVVAVALLLAAAGVPVYVLPAQQPPRAADVVLVLGPPDDWRVQWGLRLAEADHAPLLISVQEASWVPQCLAAQPVTVTCFRPDPFTTRGEARYLRAAMAEHGWTTAVVVTFTPHVTRARYVVSRCVPTGVQVVGRDPGLDLGEWVYQYGYQTAGWWRALGQDGC